MALPPPSPPADGGELDGGFCVPDVPSREAAVQWAAKIASACRCSQELRELGDDPRADRQACGLLRTSVPGSNLRSSDFPKTWPPFSRFGVRDDTGLIRDFR